MFAILEGNELLVVLLIALVAFGGAKLPQLARSLGQAQREFHKARQEDGAPKEERTETPAAENAGERSSGALQSDPTA